jgi:tagatose 1,6-diphosphate aldolase
MFKFYDIEILSDNEIDLIINAKKPANDDLGFVPAYHYHIKKHGMNDVIGQIDIRIGHNSNTFYGGNIGYGVDEDFRGNGYASKAVRLLMEVAKKHNMNKVIITCNPDNIASRKTAERAGAALLEIVDLPEDNDMYKSGETQKCIYEILVN